MEPDADHMQPECAINDCQLYQGDCLDVMAGLQQVDMVLADPPYGTTVCKWDSIIPLDPMWEQLRRLIKPNGAIVMTASQPFTSILGSSNIEQLRYSWLWRKNRPVGHMNARKAPLRDVEDLLVFTDGQPTYNPQNVKPTNEIKRNTAARIANGECYGKVGNAPKVHKYYGAGYPRQVLDISAPHNVGRHHPTQKPVALMEYMIKTYTNEGETVLDFCMGSGTTAIAALNTGRKFIGIELDPGYFDIACSRIAQHKQPSSK